MNEPARPVGGRSTNAAGQPVQMFEKVLIRAGDWYHPGTGESIPVDAKRLSHWAESFDKMAKAGVPVPVPVDHTRNPAANRGWVKSMRDLGAVVVVIVVVVIYLSSSFRGARSANPESRSNYLLIPGSALRAAPE